MTRSNFSLVKRFAEELESALKQAVADLYVRIEPESAWDIGFISVRLFGAPIYLAPALSRAKEAMAKADAEGIHVYLHEVSAIWCRRSGDWSKAGSGGSVPKIVAANWGRRGVILVCYPEDSHTDHEWGDYPPLEPAL